MKFIPRILQPIKGSFFLFGPRGTGKSVWIQKQFPDALRIDLLQPDVLQNYLVHPEYLQALIEGSPKKTQIVIDEVQKAPSLLSVVHRLIEERKRLQFILTGSSARKLKQAGVDLLAGRAVVHYLHPYMACELGDAFSLNESLRLGLVPLVLGAGNPSEALRTYAALYIQQEVLAEGLVRSAGAFGRFLEAMSFSHGELVNISNIAQDCQVPRTTVQIFIEILEDLLLGFRVPVFTKRAKRELVQHPKFYFFDAGVYRSLRPRGPLDQPEQIAGHALEGLVAQHLRAWITYTSGAHRLYFWRTRSGVEVDFVLYGDSGIYAVEVKESARVRGNDLKALKEFQADYPGARAVLLYGGKDRLKIQGIPCIPCREALMAMRPNHPLF